MSRHLGLGKPPCALDIWELVDSANKSQEKNSEPPVLGRCGSAPPPACPPANLERGPIWNRVFAGVIMGGISRRNHPASVLTPNTAVLIREGAETETRREGRVKMGTENGVMHLQAQDTKGSWSHQDPERGQEWSLLQKEPRPHHLAGSLPAPRL